MSFRVGSDGIIEGSFTRRAIMSDLYNVATSGIVPDVPRNPSGLLLLVHPADFDLPIEQLRVELHVKPKGYLRETLLSATRLTDHHCPRGQAHLFAER